MSSINNDCIGTSFKKCFCSFKSTSYTNSCGTKQSVLVVNCSLSGIAWYDYALTLATSLAWAWIDIFCALRQVHLESHRNCHCPSVTVSMPHWLMEYSFNIISQLCAQIDFVWQTWLSAGINKTSSKVKPFWQICIQLDIMLPFLIQINY